MALGGRDTCVCELSRGSVKQALQEAQASTGDLSSSLPESCRESTSVRQGLTGVGGNIYIGFSLQIKGGGGARGCPIKQKETVNAKTKWKCILKDSARSLLRDPEQWGLREKLAASPLRSGVA